MDIKIKTIIDDITEIFIIKMREKEIRELIEIIITFKIMMKREIVEDIIREKNIMIEPII